MWLAFSSFQAFKFTIYWNQLLSTPFYPLTLLWFVWNCKNVNLFQLRNLISLWLMKVKSEDTKLILVYRLDRIERGLVWYVVNTAKAAKRNTTATKKNKSLVVGLLELTLITCSSVALSGLSFFWFSFVDTSLFRGNWGSWECKGSKFS